MITRLSFFFHPQPLFSLLFLALLMLSRAGFAESGCMIGGVCQAPTAAAVYAANPYMYPGYDFLPGSCTFGGANQYGVNSYTDFPSCTYESLVDDCSTDISTLGLDLSGNPADGSCGCPDATPVFFGGACVVACAAGESRNASGVCESNCPGDTQLVNGVCGCLAGYKVGVFNGQYTCQASSATVGPPIGSHTISGGNTITDSTGSSTNIVVNADGSVTTTTTINNNTVISGGGGAGTATISNGTTTMSTTRDSAGNVISQTGTSTNETKAPAWILPGIIEKAAPAPPSGISGAFENAPIVVALGSALGAFPSGGQCSTIALNLNLPMGKVININMDEQCTMFSEIAPYLAMFAMVIYGLMSYRIFLRSASGV